MASVVASRGISRTVNGLRGGIPPVYRARPEARGAPFRPRPRRPGGTRLTAAPRCRPLRSCHLFASDPGAWHWPRASWVPSPSASPIDSPCSTAHKVGLPHRSPVEGTPADFGLAFESVEIPAGDVMPGRLVRAGRRLGRPRSPGSAPAGNRDRARLGVEPRPVDGPRPLPARRRFPLPGHRRARPRRQPARGDADERARVRRGRRGGSALAGRPSGCFGRGPAGAFDGRRRRDRGRRLRARGPGCRGAVIAGRPGPDDPQDLRDGGDAHTRPDRHSPRLPDRGRPAGPAPPFHRRRERLRRRRPVSRPPPAHAWRGRSRRTGGASRPDRARRRVAPAPAPAPPRSRR